MAYDDALFQLGMDLTRSSTAQKEDIGEVAYRSRGTVDGGGCETFAVSSHVRTSGQHQSIDLHGASHLGDTVFIERMLRRCITAAGGEVLHVHLHQVAQSGGVAGVIVLADSQVSVRSWPELGYLALDVVNRGERDLLLSADQLKRAFSAGSVTVTAKRRGETVTNGRADRAKVRAISEAKPRQRARKAA